MSTQADIESAHIRVPQPEAGQLSALADANDRSINSEGLRALRKHLEEHRQFINEYLAKKRGELKAGSRMPAGRGEKKGKK